MGLKESFHSPGEIKRITTSLLGIAITVLGLACNKSPYDDNYLQSLRPGEEIVVLPGVVTIGSNVNRRNSAEIVNPDPWRFSNVVGSGKITTIMNPILVAADGNYITYSSNNKTVYVKLSSETESFINVDRYGKNEKCVVTKVEERIACNAQDSTMDNVDTILIQREVKK